MLVGQWMRRAGSLLSSAAVIAAEIAATQTAAEATAVATETAARRAAQQSAATLLTAGHFRHRTFIV